jgi:hypothetical protein
MQDGPAARGPIHVKEHKMVTQPKLPSTDIKHEMVCQIETPSTDIKREMVTQLKTPSIASKKA